MPGKYSRPVSRPRVTSHASIIVASRSPPRSLSGSLSHQRGVLESVIPAGHFDGIFANASLFHVPCQELPRVLSELHAALKPDGVLFSSNPRENNEEGWNRGRYGAYHDLESWRAFLEKAAFSELEHYYRPPGLPREQQPWLASVWRRKSAATY